MTDAQLLTLSASQIFSLGIMSIVGLIAFAIAVDLIFNGGDGLSNIIHKNAASQPNPMDEINDLISDISDLNEDLLMCDESDTQEIEVVKAKIAVRQQVLDTLLKLTTPKV